MVVKVVVKVGAKKGAMGVKRVVVVNVMVTLAVEGIVVVEVTVGVEVRVIVVITLLTTVIIVAILAEVA